MAYSELIKDFGRIRDYMREFYVYGFKSRNNFNKKSGRSYDNERRRIESWLGDYMSFRQTPAGKFIFLSIDSRSNCRNPLYKALKSKSFTDGDITLHFILFDILYDPEVLFSISEITEKIDTEYLACFREPMLFDESTIRKKLKEYIELGLISGTRSGKQVLYSRSRTYDVTGWEDALAFFSEIGLIGVIGSFLLDKIDDLHDHFTFKHHYITHVLESEILCDLFVAISEKRIVTIKNYARSSAEEKEWEVVPLRIYISVQSGRRYLMGYNIKQKRFCSYRLDYITDVKMNEISENFFKYREKLNEMNNHMWGVSCLKKLSVTEHIEFTIRINEWEKYIFTRLEREKRCGTIKYIDENTAKFTTDVYDSWELVPWIRTFICRITQLSFSNRSVENQFKKDLEDMYSNYGIVEEENHDLP